MHKPTLDLRIAGRSDVVCQVETLKRWHPRFAPSLVDLEPLPWIRLQMRKTLTTILVLLLSIACVVVIVIGISGTSKKSDSLDIATPISTRMITPDTNQEQADQPTVHVALEGASQPLINAAAGTITWLPKPGDRIEFGTALYAVDHKPIILMEGSLPMFRDIAYKVSDGPDVAQLERNLVNLGYALDEASTGSSDDLTVDHHVTPLTESAIRSWQLSLGMTSTGVVKQGDVVFRPETVQISEVHVALGEAVEAGSVLSVLLDVQD